MIQAIFLGTGGSIPSKGRSLPSVIIKRNSEVLMFDCGEGAQRQMLLSKAGINRKMKIMISHMHGDHVLGLPGLLHSMSFLGRTLPLNIYGPSGIRNFVECMSRTLNFHSLFPITAREVSPAEIVDEKEYQIHCCWAEHSVPCLAYALVEKPRPGRFYPTKASKLGIPKGPLWKVLQSGKPVRVGGRRFDPSMVTGPPRRGIKVTYAVDTRPCRSVERLSVNSNLLIHDSTFDDSSIDKAELYGHSTATQAAKVARRSRVKRLALFHISAMYDDAKPLLRKARKIFRATVLSSDLMKLDVTN